MKNLFILNISSNRIYGLDILRAIAILFVLIQHGGNLLPENYRGVNRLFYLDGVSIFFVLSGFLIGGILLKIIAENKFNKSSLIEFWVRRWFRTVPNYLLVLVILIILNYFAGYFNPNEFWNYFIFSQNLYYSHPWFFPEAWSLSVEEWFYLIIPLILFILIGKLRLPSKQVVIFTVLLILISITAFRFYRFLNVPIENIAQWDMYFRKQVLTRLDSIMFGVIGAYIKFYFPKIWINNKSLLLITGIFLFIMLKLIEVSKLLPVGGIFNCVFSFSLTSIATLLLLPFLSNFKNGKGYLYYFLTFISLISYSMYLLNLSVVQLSIIRRIDLSGFQYIPNFNILFTYSLYWLLTIFLSIIIYKYFELPMMNLREHKKADKIETGKKISKSYLS